MGYDQFVQTTFLQSNTNWDHEKILIKFVMLLGEEGESNEGIQPSDPLRFSYNAHVMDVLGNVTD